MSEGGSDIDKARAFEATTAVSVGNRNSLVSAADSQKTDKKLKKYKSEYSIHDKRQNRRIRNSITSQVSEIVTIISNEDDELSAKEELIQKVVELIDVNEYVKVEGFEDFFLNGSAIISIEVFCLV